MKLFKNKMFLRALVVLLVILLGRAINDIFFKPSESGLEAMRKREMVSKGSGDMSVKESATLTLEKPDELLGERATAKVQDSIDIALDYLEGFDNLDGVESTYMNRLSITSEYMVQTLATMVIVGYDLQEDSLKVYRSESENVYQFIFVMSNPQREDISFVGNYVIGTQQLEVVSMKGNPISGYEVELSDLVSQEKKKEEK